MTTKEINLDKILRDAGNVGKYQWKILAWIIVPIIFSSLHVNNYIFATPEVEYRCRIPECEIPNGEFSPSWLEWAIPTGSKCYRYNPLLSPPSDPSLGNCSQQSFVTIQRTCEEYVFKDNNTFIEEMNIQCESWKRTLIGSLHILGTLLNSALIGQYSDRFGRKNALIISCLIEGIVGLIKSFSINYEMYLTLELIGPTFGSGSFSSTYILALEFLTPPYRVIGGILISMYFGIGQIILGSVAWSISYWRTFVRVLYVPAIFMFVFYWIFDESIRWQITKNRFKEAHKTIEKIVRTNGKSIECISFENLQFNMDTFTKDETIQTNDDEKDKTPIWKQFLQSKIMLLRLLKTFVWWITCNFCFYGIGINSVALPGNVYENFIILGAVEVPAHVIGYYGLTYMGRRNTICTAYLIAGVCLLSTVFIPADISWLSLTVYFVAKLFVALNFNAIYLYTSELFPTPLRHSTLALSSLIGRIGALFAPQIPLMSSAIKDLPQYIFASTCLLSAGLMLTSPETLNIELPDTVQEAELLFS